MNKPPRDLGFSLVEMLVVLLIMAIAGAATFQFVAKSESSNIDVEAAGILQLVKSAKLRARESAEVVAVSINFDNKMISGGDFSRDIIIPDDLTLRVLTGRTLVLADTIAEIKFMPKGGSSGGEIELSNENGQSRTIRINWLTGGMSIVRGN